MKLKVSKNKNNKVSLSLNIGTDKLSRIARHFSKSHGVDVQFTSEGKPSTEGDKIFIPEECKEWSKDPVLFSVLRGYLDRELWRIREIEMSKIRRINNQKITPSEYILKKLFTKEEVEKGFVEIFSESIPIYIRPTISKSSAEIISDINLKISDTRFLELLNLIYVSWEELRIQRAASNQYFGMGKNISKMQAYLQEDIRKIRLENPDQKLKKFFLEICNAPIIIENKFIEEEYNYISEEARIWIENYMPELMDASSDMRSSEDMFNITVAAIKRIVEDTRKEEAGDESSENESTNNGESKEGEDKKESQNSELNHRSQNTQETKQEGSGNKGEEKQVKKELEEETKGKKQEGEREKGEGRQSKEDCNIKEECSNKNVLRDFSLDDSEITEEEGQGIKDLSSSNKETEDSLKLNELLKDLREEMVDKDKMQGLRRPPGGAKKNEHIPDILDSRAQIFKGNYNTIPKKVRGAIPGAPKSVLQKDYIQEIKLPRKEVLDKIKSNVNYNAKTLSRKLKNIIRVMAQEDTEYDKLTGEIDDDALSDIIHGNKNIFMETSNGYNHNNIAWLFLVDMSGSMGGDKEILAIKACMAVAQAIADLGNEKFCIAGFDNPGFFYDKYLMEKNFKQYIRQENMRIQLVKKFSDPWNSVKNNTTGLMAGFNNNDGDAIRWACARLLEIDEVSRRELVVISDGVPSSLSHSYDAINKDLLDAIRESRSSGVGISSIGIFHDTSVFYGKEDSIEINNLEELSSEFIKMIRKKMIVNNQSTKRNKKSKNRYHLRF